MPSGTYALRKEKLVENVAIRAFFEKNLLRTKLQKNLSSPSILFANKIYGMNLYKFNKNILRYS